MSNIEYMKSRGIVNEVDDWALENAIECCHAARGGEDIARYAAVLRKGVNQGRKEAVSNFKERLKTEINKYHGNISTRDTSQYSEGLADAYETALELLDTID